MKTRNVNKKFDETLTAEMIKEEIREWMDGSGFPMSGYMIVEKSDQTVVGFERVMSRAFQNGDYNIIVHTNLADDTILSYKYWHKREIYKTIEDIVCILNKIKCDHGINTDLIKSIINYTDKNLSMDKLEKFPYLILPLDDCLIWGHKTKILPSDYNYIDEANLVKAIADMFKPPFRKHHILYGLATEKEAVIFKYDEGVAPKKLDPVTKVEKKHTCCGGCATKIETDKIATVTESTVKIIPKTNKKIWYYYIAENSPSIKDVGYSDIVLWMFPESKSKNGEPRTPNMSWFDSDKDYAMDIAASLNLTMDRIGIGWSPKFMFKSQIPGHIIDVCEALDANGFKKYSKWKNITHRYTNTLIDIVNCKV